MKWVKYLFVSWILLKKPELTLRKKCPYSELFWPIFSRTCTKYGEARSIFPYSVQMRKNADQNNSKYGHFSHSVKHAEIYRDKT